MELELFASVRHVKDYFEGYASGHVLSLDSSKPDKKDEKGPSPKELFLISIATCAAMHLDSALQKEQITLDRYRVDISGKLSGEGIVPTVFTSFKMIYRFEGKDLLEHSDRLACITYLSQTKYCSMVNMAKMIAPMEYETSVNDEFLPSY